MIGIKNPLNKLTTFSYESSFNNLDSVTDARGNKILYDYDSSGNLINITYENGNSKSFSYDSNGNILNWTNSRNNTIGYTYNTAGQITSKDYPDSPGIIDNIYSYDDAGNLISATDSHGTTNLTYEPYTDWLIRIDYPGGIFFVFNYNDAGQRTKRTDQDDNVVNYIYDSFGRLDQITNTTNALVVDYDYDESGHLLNKTLGNGVYTSYEYDYAGRLIHLVNYNSNDAIISQFDYTYDTSGRRISMNTLNGIFYYNYDLLGQLISVKYPDNHVVEYVYDSVGNRIKVIDNGTATTYSTNEMNQYTDVGGITYTYDNDGNMISKTEAGVTTTYYYDFESRLIGVSNSTDNWSYIYDSLGNRIESIHNGVVKKYIYDPSGLGNIAAEYDENGSLIAHYDYGFGLISKTDSDGAQFFYNFNPTGHTTELTDEDENIVNHYSYGPFGIFNEKVESIINPFTYAGEHGVLDDNNGLNYMRMRYYKPDIGRFITADTLFNIGENTYNYCKNDPIMKIDPSGLYETHSWWYYFFRPRTGSVTWTESFCNTITGKYGRGLQIIEISAIATLVIATGLISPLKSEIWYLPLLGHYIHLGFNKYFYLLSLYPSFFFPTYFPEFIHLYIFGTHHGTFQVLEITAALLFLKYIYGPTKSVGEGGGKIPYIMDPNDKIAPSGYGDAKFIPEDELLMPYTIHFENEPNATGPAQIIKIIDTIDSDLNLSTFELIEIAFADQVISIPSGLDHYETSLDLVIDNEYVSSSKIRVEIKVSLDVATRNLTLEMIGLDPETGWLPENVMLGILYPEDDSGRGEGHITYLIKHLENLPTGTEITNKASIYFDWNDPIDTPVALNTIDAGMPMSQVNPLPPIVYDSSIIVSWTGEDEANGSGIACFDVYVSDNIGPYMVWLKKSTLSEGTFYGETGHTYSFYSIVMDNVGHVEAAPEEPDSTITIVSSFDANPPITNKTIKEPKYGENNEWVTSSTEFNLTATDDFSGVDKTYYKVWFNEQWTLFSEYISNFTLIGEGKHYIEYYSIDKAGNIEETHNQTHYVDDTPPLITIETPSSWEALQDGVALQSIVTDIDGCGVNLMRYSIRNPGGTQGIIINSTFESLSPSYIADNKWQLLFETTQLPDGYYVLYVNTSDNLGNEGYKTVNFSIRNWAVLQLLPNTASNKAGRTMPVKFSLRIAAAVDPSQPFVRNEELTIKIYEKGYNETILQTSTYGINSTDYRINSTQEQYITNFKTLKTPKTYVVDIWRNDMLIGSFEFKTVK